MDEGEGSHSVAKDSMASEAVPTFQARVVPGFAARVTAKTSRAALPPRVAHAK